VRRNIRTVLSLASVLALGLGVVATQATGKVKKFNTGVTIEFSNPDGYRFAGDVTSKKSKCIRNRSVELRYVTDSDPDEHVRGSTITDETGHWQIDPAGMLLIADYYAVVEKKKFRKHGKKRVCKRGISPSVNPADL
jgi:hypothetical protein